LSTKAPHAAFEVGNGKVDVDRLLETDNWSVAKNTGRTGRDRC
jgi:hypothetical protein